MKVDKEGIPMPTLSQFYGITIKMYFEEAEHHPPHFHVLYGEWEGEYDIKTGTILAGEMPRKASRLVRKWASLHRDELQEIWETQEFIRIKPLE